MQSIRVGFAVCGSFCTHARAMEALEQIATALSDESHSDENCVDHILYILRGIGISCGNRHHIPAWDE